jgi:hypothetical protein
MLEYIIMLEYFGKTYTYNEIREHAGSMAQLAGARRIMFTDGRAKGVEAVEVHTGSGLSFTVVQDRCLDIAWAEYRGIPLSYISPTGITAPAYYESQGGEWLRGFFAGLLTTCGFTHVGGACTVGDTPHGLHGRASNLAAEAVCVDEGYEDGKYVMAISGKVRQAKTLTENILLKRKIKAWAGKNRIRLEDTIENAGYTRQPFMLLYHCNLGFPLVNEKAAIYIPNDGISPRYEDQALETKDYGRIPPPTDGYKERVFFFKTKPSADGMCRALIINDRENPVLGLQISYSPNVLDNLALWKLMTKGDYVVGIEPCNNFIQGQEQALKDGNLKYLEAQEQKQVTLEFEILGQEEIAKARSELA